MIGLAGKSIAQTVTEYIRPAVEESYELYDLEFVKEGASRYLRIYIDKPGGVTIDDCEKVSRAVEGILDEKDPIESSYILEVSSPGLDRALKKDQDFIRYTGSEVEIRLYKARGGVKKYVGELTGLAGGVVSIRTQGGTEETFDRKEIAACKLVY